jgi:hypothetical protein
VTAELILVLTLLICSVGVGVAVVKDAVATELNDISDAIGTFDQSFTAKEALIFTQSAPALASPTVRISVIARSFRLSPGTSRSSVAAPRSQAAVVVEEEVVVEERLQLRHRPSRRPPLQRLSQHRH